jgi:hypothetical protein
MGHRLPDEPPDGGQGRDAAPKPSPLRTGPRVLWRALTGTGDAVRAAGDDLVRRLTGR